MAEFETDKIKKLRAQRAAIDARMRQEQNKLQAGERKSDTRRKVLAGAAVLELAKKDNDFSTLLMNELGDFLKRDADRAVFGLPPMPGEKVN